MPPKHRPARQYPSPKFSFSNVSEEVQARRDHSEKYENNLVKIQDFPETLKVIEGSANLEHRTEIKAEMGLAWFSQNTGFFRKTGFYRK